MNLTIQEIVRQAGEVAGSLWDDRDRAGMLADQLRAVAAMPSCGTDGDLSDEDRNRLLSLADAAEEIPISSNPHIHHGQPVISGTRVTVRALADAVRGGQSVEETAADYGIAAKAVRAAVAYEEG